MKIPEQSAESSVTFDLASSRGWTVVYDWEIVSSLIRSLMVVVLNTPTDKPVEMHSIDRYESVETHGPQ